MSAHSLLVVAICARRQEKRTDQLKTQMKGRKERMKMSERTKKWNNKNYDDGVNGV